MRKKIVFAFIPARSGSKRVLNKNIKVLGDHPLIAYSIQSAIQSSVFDKVVCVTDDSEYADIARYYGAEVPELRPKEIAGDCSTDFEWLEWALGLYNSANSFPDAFSILRPTNPFRSPDVIKRALDIFMKDSSADSLRAIEKVKEHPGKMWILNNNRMFPILPYKNGLTPWHSSQYAALPEIFVQNASLEICWTKSALNTKSISGNIIIPFVSHGLEGFDINNPEDWILANYYLENGDGKLVDINIKPYKKS